MIKKNSKSPAASALHDELAALARGHAKLAVEALVDELKNGKGSSRVSAANALLERGFGKSRQPLDLDGSLDIDPVLPDEILNVLDGIYMNMR